MWVPAAHASLTGDHDVAQAFFYSGVIVMIVTGMVMLAMANRRLHQERQRLEQLSTR